jgi:glycosyltransferase involved in cell wall biosynthesis
MMRRADRAAAAVVVNAKAIREVAIAQGVAGEKICTIPNLLDLVEFDELSARDAGWESRLPVGPRVVMVSRLDLEKDAGTLIQAAAHAAEQRRDVSFVLAGDGPDLPALRSLAAQLGIGRQVMFLGDVKDVPSLLRSCQVGALLPKANEGLSNSILEYMAARLPVVASDCGGNRELVSDGDTGFIVPVGNADAAAKALMQILEDPARAQSMGCAGRDVVKQHHVPDVVVDQYADLYRTVDRQTQVALTSHLALW